MLAPKIEKMVEEATPSVRAVAGIILTVAGLIVTTPVPATAEVMVARGLHIKERKMREIISERTQAKTHVVRLQEVEAVATTVDDVNCMAGMVKVLVAEPVAVNDMTPAVTAKLSDVDAELPMLILEAIELPLVRVLPMEIAAPSMFIVDRP